jgi:hypothetical protein
MAPFYPYLPTASTQESSTPAVAYPYPKPALPSGTTGLHLPGCMCAMCRSNSTSSAHPIGCVCVHCRSHHRHHHHHGCRCAHCSGMKSTDRRPHDISMVDGTHNHTEHRHHHHHHHLATPITLRAVDYRDNHTVQDHPTIAGHTTAIVLGTVLPVIALVFFAFFVWERCMSRKKKQEGKTNEGTFVVSECKSVI